MLRDETPGTSVVIEVWLLFGSSLSYDDDGVSACGCSPYSMLELLDHCLKQCTLRSTTGA